MARRWGRSEATVCRVLGKLDELRYINCLNFSGNLGTVLYLNGYLSTMFNITDVPADRVEVFFALKLRIRVEESELPASLEPVENSVSKPKNPVSKELMEILASKVLEMLSQQGFACCGCGKKAAKLYTYLESRMRSMQQNRQMLAFIDRSVSSMRKYDRNGEEFYWIIYLKYMAPGDEKCTNDADNVHTLLFSFYLWH